MTACVVCGTAEEPPWGWEFVVTGVEEAYPPQMPVYYQQIVETVCFKCSNWLRPIILPGQREKRCSTMIRMDGLKPVVELTDEDFERAVSEGKRARRLSIEKKRKSGKLDPEQDQEDTHIMGRCAEVAAWRYTGGHLHDATKPDEGWDIIYKGWLIDVKSVKSRFYRGPAELRIEIHQELPKVKGERPGKRGCHALLLAAPEKEGDYRVWYLEGWIATKVFLDVAEEKTYHARQRDYENLVVTQAQLLPMAKLIAVKERPGTT